MSLYGRALLFRHNFILPNNTGIGFSMSFKYKIIDTIFKLIIKLNIVSIILYLNDMENPMVPMAVLIRQNEIMPKQQSSTFINF